MESCLRRAAATLLRIADMESLCRRERVREGEGGEVVAVVLEGLVSCEVVGETEALLSLF